MYVYVYMCIQPDDSMNLAVDVILIEFELLY